MNITGTIIQNSHYGVGGFHGSNALGSGAFYRGDKVAFACSWSTYDDNYALGFDASKSWTGETSAVGSNKPFDIMPPYITAYCWKRIS